MSLNDQLHEVFTDLVNDTDHPAWDRLDATEAELSPELRGALVHELGHFISEGGSIKPGTHLYLAMIFGFLLGTEFAKRGYEVTA